MARRIRNKPLKVTSLTKKSAEKIEDAVIEEEVVKETVKEEIIKETTKSTPPPIPKSKPKVISPILAEPVDVKDHAMGVGPQPANNSAASGESFRVDQSFFSGSQKSQPTPEVKGPELATPPPQPQIQNFPPDAPTQEFTIPGSGPLPSISSPGGDPVGGDNVDIPDDIARQSASELTDTLMTIYVRMVPDVSHSATKMNAKEIKKLEESGDLMAGAHEEVVSQNKENKSLLTSRAKEDAAMIKKPLKRLLEVKQISAPPHVELIIILIFVAVTYFMTVREIKKNNESLLERLYAKINQNRGPVKSDDDVVPFAEVENVV